MKKLIGGIVLTVVTIFMVGVITVAFAARLHLPGIPEGFLVQSGSMEPTIHVGDLVLVTPAQSYQVQDVVTFYDINHRVVTHRIIGLNSGASHPYTTQGDANQTPDTSPLAHSQIIGKVAAVVPRLGILVTFAHSQLGFMLLIVVPAIIIILDELIKMYGHLRSQR